MMLYKLLFPVAISIVIYGVLALGLILSQSTQQLTGTGGLAFQTLLARDPVPWPKADHVTMRDGFELSVRDFPNDSGPLVVLVHGSGWHGQQFDRLAPALAEQAHVLVPDLRGHGAQPGRRGDVDYIGQLEDDLSDLITAYRRPGQKLVLLGHSSGGGLVVRYAGGAQNTKVDHAILLAPFLKHDAPTMRPDSGGWTNALLRRIIGLSMLNMAKITVLNHLTILQLNMPKEVLDGPLGHTATTAYSYRLNASFAPRSNYLSDVAALPKFHLIAGTRDEAFLATAYEPTLAPAHGGGTYQLIDGVGHLDVVDHPETIAAIKQALSGL